MVAASATAVASAISGKMPAVNGCGPLELLVVQPTPFCNIDCSYCYLPDRRNTRKITAEILEQTFAWMFRSGLVREPFTLLWHAGEPTVLPASFYEEATVLLERCNDSGLRGHSVVPDQRHIDQRRLVRLHQASQCQCRGQRRRTRVPARPPSPHAPWRRHIRENAAGDAAAARPRHRLQHHHGPDRGFARLSRRTVRFLRRERHHVGLVQRRGDRGAERRLVACPQRHGGALSPLLFAISRSRACGGSPDGGARIRDCSECDRASRRRRAADPGEPALRHPQRRLRGQLLHLFARAARPQRAAPWQLRARQRGDGIPSRRCWRSRASSRSTRRSAAASNGVTRPAATSPFCGGGPPGNKFFENGDFATTETLSCRLHKQVTFDVALNKLERIAAAQEGLAAAE